MSITVCVCPFALFGNPGTQHGAELLGDAVREMLDDTRRERRPTRAKTLVDQIEIKEIPLATPADYREWRAKARSVAKEALEAGRFLLWIGGNHLSVAPLYEELGERPGSLIVQFDAHLDVYHYHDTVPNESHGNFLRRIIKPPAIVNVGHRDLFLPDDEIGKYFESAYGIADIDAAERRLHARARKAKRVVVDIDWDVLDPAFFPAVGDPLPFGMVPVQLLRLTRGLSNKNVASVSFSEFDPGRDEKERSLQLAAWLIEQILQWRADVAA